MAARATYYVVSLAAKQDLLNISPLKGANELISVGITDRILTRAIPQGLRQSSLR